MSTSFTNEHGTGQNHSQQVRANSQLVQHNADDESSVDNEGEDSSSLYQDQGFGNMAIGNLLDDSSEGSVSLFLDSANSSVNMRQNESDDENNGGVVVEQSQVVSQDLTSLLYRDIAIPHYNVPKPYHWDNHHHHHHPESRSRLGSEDEDDEEQQQQTSESRPFVNVHPSTGSSVSSRLPQNPSDYDNRNMRRLFTSRRTGVEPQSLVADSPIEFGRSRQGFKDYNGPARTLEQFHDEPYSLDYGRSVIASRRNNKNSSGGLEALPNDEYDPNSEVKQTSRHGKKLFLLEKTGRGIGLVLFTFGFVIVLSTGITILLNMLKDRSHVQFAQSSLTLPPTSAPSGMPTRNPPIAPAIPMPTITFPPSGQLVVTVEVLNDEYVDLGGLVLRTVHVQHTDTLLVQDGLNLSAAISIIEFDTVATVGPLSAIVPWLVSATIQLTIASDAEVDDVIRLYAKLYPNAIAKQPQGDINNYGSGQIDFQDGWIPFEIIPNQTEVVDIDVTQFVQRRFFPSRTHQKLKNNDDNNTNIKVMLAYDNTDGGENKGTSVQFYSSESASPSQRPRLIFVLQEPDFSLSPAPATTPVPTIGPTISLTPAPSSKPSSNPSVSPSLYPSTSFDPSYHPTKSPEPTNQSYASCSICGGLIFANADATISGFENLVNVSSQETTCGSMQEMALDGELSPTRCQQVQSQVSDTCCHPIDNNSSICDLCGGNLTTTTGTVVNLDTVVSIPVLGEVQTCRYYQERATAGMISASLCSTMQPSTAPTCCGILL